ncbi:nucleotidyl transferase AbiEii/AbiGii toxin family protein [Halarcobacter sp.]|uniref:nucleotidyl transferase AbiEii/AbiGii toxin family protein n=1 Tax=Halarcobacter sp. TaxID=2321133 RepID=UPI002AAB7E39|nr:nucleotidyl transferase AbiEii/AbiGii toxin family protein [Halarcobacter sp.]
MSIDINGAMPKKTEILFDQISLSNELDDFTLVGGTALAIYLKHRTSEDLDFFINKNKINTHLKLKIDSLIKRLKKDYKYSINLDSNDDDVQIDYMFGDVKVTFLATSLDVLEGSIKYNHINIASKDKIIAGKLYTILKYRIKSRDFYDVKYSMIYEKITLVGIFDLMIKYYGKLNFTEKYITDRLLKTNLNIDDEGFESLKLKVDENFKTLRNFFKKEIQKLNNEKIEIVSFSMDEIKENIHKKYGLLRTSIIMELYEINRSEELYNIDFQKLNVNLFYKNLNGQTIFHLVKDDDKLFDYLLFYTESIDEEIKAICKQNGNDIGLNLIEKHRLLNRCLYKTEIKVLEIIENKEVNKKEFLSDLEKKRKILNR